MTAATICAAEFEVSRSFPKETAFQRVFKLMEVANGQIASHWSGSQPGAISFIYEDTTARAVLFDGILARYTG